MRLFYTDEKVNNKIFYYMLGFQPDDGLLLLDESSQQGRVFLDSRYIDHELRNDQAWTIYKIPYVRESILSDIANRISDVLLLEKSLPYSIYEWLAAGLSVKRDTASRQKSLRITKSAEQIDALSVAIAKTNNIRDRVNSLAIAGELQGMTELALRGRIIEYAFSLDLEGEAFDAIIASGKHSAIPHHHSSTSIINDGPLLVDMGFVYQGYCSDMTRCVWLGDHDERYDQRSEIYTIAQQAHDLAHNAVQAGVAAQAIDTLARDYIQNQGYGKYFTHSLGHGVGLDVHECPYLSHRSDEVLDKGMICTIEPGIYLPNQFGVRYETIVMI